jgi:predicted 3-demethylubiquinone-9 3-methyltransferase (glyoxalase superfamily)
MEIKQKIPPFLWFDYQAEEAINFYTSIFKDSEVGNIARYGNAEQFMALNGGPMFKFNEAISLFVDCKDQDEVDYFWDKLSDGGEKSRCGWLKDKFGLSWQVVPSALGELLYNTDPQTSGRVMQAMMKMDKIIIQDLRDAAEGK